MEPQDKNKVFYYVDQPNSDVTPLPPGSRCAFCKCDPRSHGPYWFCPLLNDFICSSCCQQEVPDVSNQEALLKLCPDKTSPEAQDVCRTCGRNSLS